ncbi:tetrahydroanabasine acetyltransferase-like [Silene latifolia]|uniref:tetrahydroanabasine acetyltransferase-like n=1 Tax=Silene latifolia TaxID=37657 RepID=UPI003D7722B2
MEVTIQETITIFPSNSPFNENHVLPLSDLDTDRNLDVTFRYFRVYSNQNNEPDPFNLITTALAEALVPYYPFTGCLQRNNAEDGRVELHCNLGSRVPMVRATLDSTLESVNYLDDPDESFSEQLVPNPDPNEAMDHPMVLQITMFKCGGYVLGPVVQNMLCDGLGASEFFNWVAELTRDSNKTRSKPDWNRVGLLGPREPLSVEFPFGELLTLDKDFSPYLQPVGPVGKVCFDMDDAMLDRFKAYLLEKSGSRFTTFEALGAFIWQAKVKSSKIQSNEKVKFAYLMNIRKLMNPPLPKGYWGNACTQMYVQLTSKELQDLPIWEIAELIKKSKYNATNEYVRSYIDFQKINYEKGISGGTEVSGFTDWKHIGHSTVDFGSGGPVTVFPLSKNFLGSMEPCYFLPFSSVDKEKMRGFKLLVYLREYAMEGFKEEMEKLCGEKYA